MSNEVTAYHYSGSAMMLDKNMFEQAYRAARLFASSQLVPKHFQGKEADCFIGLMVAQRMKEDPLTVLQNMFIVNGRPGWSTQYMIARANAAGVFKSRISWKTIGKGEDLVVTAAAVLADTGEEVSVAVSMAMAKAEDWVKNAKYRTMPEHMLRWRSAAMLIRLYAPEVMLGYQTEDELETLPPMKDITPNPVLAELNEKIATTQTEPAVFDIATANLKTQVGIKAAIRSLCAVLETVPQDDRAGLFVTLGGPQVVSAASTSGLGPQTNKIADLGINLIAGESNGGQSAQV